MFRLLTVTATTSLYLLLIGSGIVGFSAVPVRAENITIVGTGDGMAILRSIGTAFSTAHPGITIVVPDSIGSSGGIKAVGYDKFRIGRVARTIKESEKPFGLTYIPFAKVAAVFFVNKSVGVTNLTTPDVLNIFSGRTRNWQDVGGVNGKIRVVRREEGDSTLSVLRQTLTGFSDIAFLSKSKVTTTTQQTLKVISKTTGAIGFGPYPEARQAGLKIVTIDSRLPTSKEYPSFTTLALILKEKNNTGSIRTFINFLTSSAGQKAIRRANAVPY